MDLHFGGYRLIQRDRQVLGPNGPLDLSARGFDILRALLEKPGEVIGKEDLLAAVWPGVVVEENTLQVHVSALRKALAPDMIVTVHGRGYKYAGPEPVPSGAGAPAAKPDAKPVIAVLPFDNLSGDPEQQYFSDGITEDIIDRLAKYRILSVIGHHSSFAMRGRDADLHELRDKLSADYVLTGNVRNSGSRIRIAARLTDARNGNALWAEHYDRPLADVFEVQDEVAAIIAGTLMGRVELESGLRSGGAGRDVSSYEHVLHGIWHFKTFTVEGNEIAAQSFRKALAINPGNAEALRWLSSYHVNRWFMVHDRAELEASVALARKAAGLDPTSAMCHTALGLALLWAEGCAAAGESYRRAFHVNPGDPNVLAEMALLHTFDGDLAAADALFDRAARLNPLPPLWYAEFRAIADFVRGRYAQALPGFAALPECAFDTAYVAACLGHLEDHDGIARVMPRIRERNWDLVAVAADEPYRDPAVRARLVDGVRRALALAAS